MPAEHEPRTDEYPHESYTTPCVVTNDNDFTVDANGIRHCFVWPERAMTVNQGLRGSWHASAQFIKDWREPFRLMSQGCAPLAWCNVTVRTIHGSDRKMDVCAEALAVKAALDGIVDGGVLPDDNPLYVRSVKFLPPVFIDGEERVIVTLDGPPA